MFEGVQARRYDARIEPAASVFVVELPIFSGPFKLLTGLVLEQKIDVCDVPLAGITESFLRRGIESLDAWSLEEGTWFLAICAALLELKVGRLLPRLGVESEEELLGGVSPDLVYARSLELAAFRRLAEDLADRMAAASLMVARSAGPPSELAHLYPDLMEKVSGEALQRTAARLLRPPPPLDLSHVTPIRATVSAAVEAIRERLLLTPEASFREVVSDCQERIEVVVRFLALLELYREGKVELSQAGVFGEIQVRWQERADAQSRSSSEGEAR
jgi:segregation and condensation protein A